MKKRQLIIIGSTVLIIASAVASSMYFASQKEEPEVKRPPEIKKYVATTPVSYSDVQTDVIAYGRVETAQSLDLLSEVSGRMYQGSVRLKAGSNFKKGTLLFYIDDTEASLNLKSQKSNYLRDLAAVLPDLKLDFSNSYDVWKAYFSSIDIGKDLPELPSSLSDKEMTFLSTKGIFSSYYTIKSAEVRLKKHKYYAPFDGSISELMVETGAFVNPGNKIGKIIRAGVHELRVSVETRDIPWIVRGTEVGIYADDTKAEWQGEITRISDFVNQQTQSIDVYIKIYPNEERIYDGQFLQASIPAQVIKDGMVIPRNIIYNGNEVFVVQDSLLKVRNIDILRLTEQEAVFNGVSPGELLVTEPLINAHNNMKVFNASVRDINMEVKDEAGKELSSASQGDSSNQGN